MRWLDFVWAAPVLMALGCGSNVATDTGGGGPGGSTTTTSSGGTGGTGGAQGGAGGATTTTSTTTTSTTTTSTTTGTGGAGGAGGSPCDQACGLAEMCGLPAGQCGMFLDCSTPQGSCFADCVNQPGVDCAALFAAVQGQPGPVTDCVQGCQGMGGAGGGGGQGGAPPADCQQCGQNNCQNAGLQCFQQAGAQECQDWLNCAGGCADAACFDACTAMYPGGGVIAQCACSSCATECAAVCGGSGSGGAGGAGAGGAGMGGAGAGGAGMGDPQACQSCGQQQCGPEVQQCFGNFNQCQSWLSCSQACQDKACIDQCTAMFPAGAPVGACICDKCLGGGCGFTCD